MNTIETAVERFLVNNGIHKSIECCTVVRLLNVIAFNDLETSKHSLRVAKYSSMIGRAMDFNDNDIKTLILSSLIHDLGKAFIPNEILNKADKHTEEEFAVMKQHSAIGADVIKNLNILAPMADFIINHHEKYDGTGYPDKRKAEDIPLFARVISVADAFDAMTSKRPYKAQMSWPEAVRELQAQKWKQFDGSIVDKLVSVIKAD